MTRAGVGGLLGLAVLVLSALGCGDPTPLRPPDVMIEPIAIESLELVTGLVTASGLGVHVRGLIGDGCSDLLPPITQRRDGSVVRIGIQRQRQAAAVCTQIAKLFDQVLPLEGAFGTGEYTVVVNDRTLTFSLPL